MIKISEGRGILIREDNRNVLRVVGEPQPLILLDGQPLPEGTRLESIEPSDVLSIDVFKSNHLVTTEYGERGKNGVVRITTREKVALSDTLPKHTLPEIWEKPRQEEAFKLTDVVILVDGVEVKTFEGVNPNQIESITVLKGAEATDLYGERAKDGVILVRTKKK